MVRLAGTMARQRTPEGPAPAPVVQRLRIRYARRGRLRFSSARDFSRALERALRRAEVPMAFSAGFHPHPRISYAGGAPMGVESEAEYLEIAVAERVDPQAVRATLDDALPTGLDILEVVEAGPGSLADRLEASVWQVALPGLPAGELAASLGRFLDQESVLVTRVLKTGPRDVDVRAAVVQARPDSGGGGADADPYAILTLVVRHTTPAVRPDDVLAALRSVTGLVPPRPPRVTRLAQGPLEAGNGSVTDPLATDKDAAGP